MGKPFGQLARRCFATATTTIVSTSSASSVPKASSATDAITHLRSQPSHYVVANLMGRRHILAPRDLLTVPRLKSVNVGDRLILSNIHEVGSRDYTLRASTLGADSLPNGIVRVEATVVEHTKGAMERIVKFKRRKHYQKTIRHKQPYTRLRIGPIEFGKVDSVAQSTP